MKVNSRVFTEKSDMLGIIQLPNCPSQFRTVAEQLMMMITKPGYSAADYNNVTQLDKILTACYWQEYDELVSQINIVWASKDKAYHNFQDWFIHKATSPDLISRSVRWLVSHNYIFLKPEVQERAMEASNKWRQAIGH